MISTPWKFCSCIQELKNTISFFAYWNFSLFTFYCLRYNLTEISGTFKYIRSPSLKICHFEFWLRQLKTKFVPILPNITSPGGRRLCFASPYIFSLVKNAGVSRRDLTSMTHWSNHTRIPFGSCDWGVWRQESRDWSLEVKEKHLRALSLTRKKKQ